MIIRIFLNTKVDSDIFIQNFNFLTKLSKLFKFSTIQIIESILLSV